MGENIQTGDERVRSRGDVLEDLPDHRSPNTGGSVDGQDGDHVHADLPAQVVAKRGGSHHVAHGVNLLRKRFNKFFLEFRIIFRISLGIILETKQFS